MEIDPNTLNQLFLALIAFITAFTAWLASRNSTKINTVVTEQAAQGAKINSMDTAQSIQMVTGQTATIQAVEAPFYRTMTDAAKKENMRGLTPDQQASFLSQVAFNEDARNVRYTVAIPPIGFLVIENGCAIDDQLEESKVN